MVAKACVWHSDSDLDNCNINALRVLNLRLHKMAGRIKRLQKMPRDVESATVKQGVVF